MRQVTREIVDAFYNRVTRTIGNSSTDGKTLFLHGNAIAEWREDGLYITNARWFSVTTKERLNGLEGVSIFQKNGAWFLNGNPWDGSWIKIS